MTAHTLRPLPNPSAVFRSRIIFTTLPPAAAPRKCIASYPLTVKGRTYNVPLLESSYHHPEAPHVPLALFSIDGVLTYSAFAHDHGPLNVAQVHHLAVLLEEIFGDPGNEGRAVCLFSAEDEREKAAAACLLASYFVSSRGADERRENYLERGRNESPRAERVSERRRQGIPSAPCGARE